MEHRFRDRVDAGQRLAARLGTFAGKPNVVVLALARGGVPVGYEVARSLGVPLDVYMVRKLGVPGHGELAMGAVAPGGIRVINEDVIDALHIPPRIIDAVAAVESDELDRRTAKYRHGRSREPVKGYTVLLVDDGLATGATMRAAVMAVRQEGPAYLVVAVPVGARSTCQELEALADEVICLEKPEQFLAVGFFYDEFSQVNDEDVASFLAHASHAPRKSDTDAEVKRIVVVPAGNVMLQGELILPHDAHGVVLFAHGSGSSQYSPRNRYVAQMLRASAGVGTLLLDLLSAEEEQIDFHTGQLRFDIPLLASRVASATDWLLADHATHSLAIGYFGASTGAAAALVAAEKKPEVVRAIVSRGGRPDLAADALPNVRAPTLFIVGGADVAVVEMNRRARALLTCENQLEIVPSATHLFEEPRALESVARLAAQWFKRFLVAGEARGAA